MPSVLVPVLYVFIVVGGLSTFSYFYRKRSAAQSLDPYFASHPERNAYVTLLQRDPPVSDALLKSALVRRAIGDVHRVLRLREDKPALQNLLQKGSIGDDLWNSLLAAEKELEAEIVEVVNEANTFVEGWGQVIFQTANEMIANEKMRAVFEHSIEARAEKEAKYGKAKSINVMPVSPAPLPGAPQPGPNQSPVPALGPKSPQSPNPKVANLKSGPESVASTSDAESTVSASPSATKSGKKKNKKRK